QGSLDRGIHFRCRNAMLRNRTRMIPRATSTPNGGSIPIDMNESALIEHLPFLHSPDNSCASFSVRENVHTDPTREDEDVLGDVLSSRESDMRAGVFAEEGGSGGSSGGHEKLAVSSTERCGESASNS